MVRKRAMTWLVGAALLMPALAFAQTAYTNRGVNLRAGPNQDFPLVSYLGGGVPVHVNGCIEGYTWCDVTAGNERGWLYADYISYPYNNQPVTVISGGPWIGLPIISFSIGPYWDNYYRHRPWYGNRHSYYDRPANWWYRAPPQRYSQPVVRPYPYYRDGNRDGRRDGRYDDGRRDGRYDDGRNNNRPHAERAQQQAQPRQNNKPRVERPATGELDRSSQSQRTYSQQ